MSLEVKNLSKKYGEKTVLESLSFSMEKPGVYALLGTNGAVQDWHRKRPGKYWDRDIPPLQGVPPSA